MQVATDDINLKVEIIGTGLPLVLLHGAFLNRTAWERQVDGLQAHFQLVIPDLRGHGATPCPVTPRSFERARDVISILDHLNLAQAIFVGHSMGGPIALQIALDYPNRCLGLVLLATGPGPADRPLIASQEQKEQAEAWAQQMLALGVVDYFFKTETAGAPGVKEFFLEAANRKIYEAILNHNDPEKMAGWLRLGGCDIPEELSYLLTSRRTGRLQEIQSPVLFMVGSRDGMFLPMADFLKNKIPHTIIEIVPEATHMLTIDAAQEVNQAILSFGRTRQL